MSGQKKVSTQEATELNGVLYECDQKLAELLEYLRMEYIRVKVWHYLREKPRVGYIRARAGSAFYGQVRRPIVLYNRRAKRGRWVDEDVLSKIEFSNKSRGDVIWTRDEGALLEFELPLKSVG